MQEERQVVVAARREEPDHRLVASDGVDDLLFGQRPAVVLVDELEALARGVFELVRKFLDLLRGPRGIERALGRAIREFVFERDLDALLPARNIDR